MISSAKTICMKLFVWKGCLWILYGSHWHEACDIRL